MVAFLEVQTVNNSQYTTVADQLLPMIRDHDP